MLRLRRLLKLHYPFFIALSAAVVFRFIGLSDRPFDSDELGALFRTQNASSFQSHIDQGVRIDGHPALVQTFLWFNSQKKLFSPYGLKILWSILSLISVCFYYVYFCRRLGVKSAFIATCSLFFLVWPSVMGQWVRPYTIGFFWLSIFSFGLSLRGKHLYKFLLAAIALSLATYSHYFAGLTGYCILCLDILLRKTRIKHAIFIGLGPILLFIPHLGIFFGHLNEGGLSWLGTPSRSFFLEHFYFVLNRSNLLVAEVLIALAVQLVWLKWKNQTFRQWKTSVYFFTIWFFVALTGFVYSHLFKPVLQNNVLYFALPFLIGSIAFFFKNTAQYMIRLWSVLWISSMIYSAVVEKGYYSTSKIDKYAYPIQQIHELKSQGDKSTPIIDGPTDVLDYHLDTLGNEAIALQRQPDVSRFFDSVTRLSNDSHLIVINSGSRMDILTAMYTRLQFLDIHGKNSFRQYFQGGEWVKATNKKSSYWEGLKHYNTRIPASSPHVFVDFSKLENLLGKIDRNDILLLSVEDTTEQFKNGPTYHLVSALFQKGFNQALQQIDYRYTSNKSILNTYKGYLHHPLKLSDIPNWDSDCVLRISYEAQVDSSDSAKSWPVVITRIPGNPFLYGYPTKQTFGN